MDESINEAFLIKVIDKIERAVDANLNECDIKTTGLEDIIVIQSVLSNFGFESANTDGVLHVSWNKTSS